MIENAETFFIASYVDLPEAAGRSMYHTREGGRALFVWARTGC